MVPCDTSVNTHNPSLITHWPTWACDSVTFGHLDRLGGGGGLSHGNYFPYISKTTSTGARISNCSWDYLRAGETDTALMVTYVALMECQGLMQDSIHTHTHTHTAPTKDSCVKLMENRIVWAVDLWLYIQPHKARSGVKCDSVVEKKTELMYISKLLISQCQIFPSADHQRRAMSCDREFPAEMWMAVSFWQHSCWSLA